MLIVLRLTRHVVCGILRMIDGWIKLRGRLVVRHFVARKAIQPSLGYGHQSENLVL